MRGTHTPRRVDVESTALCSRTQIGRRRAPQSLRRAPPTSSPSIQSKTTTSTTSTSSSTAATTTTAATPTSPAATEAARATAFCREPAAEVLTPTPLVIKVKDASRRPFPPWLRGELWRVGPGCFPAPMRHLFDGFAMVAKLEIDGRRTPTRITHQQRFLETRAWKAFKEKGRPGFSEFGTPQPVPEALLALAKTALGIGEGSWTDNASVTIRPVPPLKETKEREKKESGEEEEETKEKNTKGRTTMLAATESVAGWVLLDASDLSTLGNAQLLSSDGVPGELTTAHAQLSRRGKLINLVSAIGGESVLVSQDPTSLARVPVASLAPRSNQSPLLGRPWVHEFPCAGRFAVVPEGSLPMDLVGALTGKARHFMFSWLPQLGTRYHVVDLEAAGKVSSSSSSSSPSSSSSSSSSLPVAPFFDHPDPNFYFHVVNAFVDDEAKEFAFDVPAHADAAMLDVLALENLRSNARTVTRSRLTRVRVPLPETAGEGGGGKEGEGQGQGRAAPPTTKSVRVERLFADADLDEREPFFFEFPSPNPSFRGNKGYRFAWGLSAVMPTSAGNALAKVDVSGKENVKVWHEAGCLPGEPLMVPRPPSKRGEGGDLVANEEKEGDEEDDGVVLSLVVGADGGSFLLVLDARSMEEVARAELGAGLPYGFHCCWVDGGDEG